MELRQRDGYFLLKSGNTRIGVFYSESPKVQDEMEISVNYDNKGSYSIQTAGEYEVDDVFVMVFEKGGSRQYVLNVAGVGILLADPQATIDEKDLEDIGSVDVLFLNGSVIWNNDLVKFINRLDPQMLILQRDIENGSSVAKLFGSEIRNVSKKLKVSFSDFESEEYKLEIIKIDEK